MHIAFGVDNSYAQHVGVTLASVLKNLALGIVPHIHVVTDGLTEENKEKIASLKIIHDFSIEYHTVSLEDFRDFPLITIISPLLLISALSFRHFCRIFRKSFIWMRI